MFSCSNNAVSRNAAVLLTTVEFVRVIAAVVLAVAVVRASYTLEVLTVELQICAVLVNIVTIFAFVSSVSTVVVVITRPTLPTRYTSSISL